MATPSALRCWRSLTGLAAALALSGAMAADTPAASRYAFRGDIRPLDVDATGRYTLVAEARKSGTPIGSGRFVLKSARGHAGTCAALHEDLFGDGFEGSQRRAL